MSFSYRPHDSRRRRRGLAVVAVLHLLLLWALVSGTARRGLEILKKPLEAVVIQEVIIPPPPPPPPPPPKDKPPEPKAPPPPVPPPYVPPPDTPAPLSTAPAIVAVATPPPAPVVIAPPPPPAPPAPAPPAPVAPQPVVQAPATKPDTSKVQIESLESEYVMRLRTVLNATKRYPTGRQASQQRPQGKVKLLFTVSRSGTLISVSVKDSSDSNLLDDAALSTVRRAAFPPFPANTFSGQEQHLFSAELDFAPPA